MTAATGSPSRGQGFPSLSVPTLITMLVAGALATVAFDLFGHAIAPMLGWPNLAPVPLATQTWQVVFGQSYPPGGNLLHYVAGLIAYPLGWMFIWRPLFERFLPWLPSAVLYGVALWIFALFVMAHLVAGNPPFLGFTGITWVALAGHILFAIITALVARARANA